MGPKNPPPLPLLSHKKTAHNAFTFLGAMGGLDIPFHYGDLPPSYDEPLTLEQRLDIMEMNVREKIEVASGFADVEVQRRRLVSVFKFFDAPATGICDYTTFMAAMVRMNFVGAKEDLEKLFARYDFEGKGAIEYEQFAHGIFKAPEAAPAASHELY